jgi:hypothetical protein
MLRTYVGRMRSREEASLNRPRSAPVGICGESATTLPTLLDKVVEVGCVVAAAAIAVLADWVWSLPVALAALSARLRDILDPRRNGH